MKFMKKKKPATSKKGRYVISAEILHYLRGALIMQERRNINWKEFAEIVGLSHWYIGELRGGRMSGGRKSVNRLLALRNRGIMIHPSDFLEES